MKLTDKHITLHKAILSREVGKICNDLLPEELSLLNKMEWQELCKNYHEWNGDLEEFVPTRPVMFDFMVVDYINHLLYEKALKE